MNRTNPARILLVEDEPDIAEVIRLALEREGLVVEWASDGDRARERLDETSFDLVLLDLILPDIDGLELCQIIRSSVDHASMPVVMLTSKTEEDDIVRGFDEGADDYIKKPFSNRELVARVKASLRRARGELVLPRDRRPIEVGRVTLDPVRHKAHVDDRPISLTLAEFRLLHCLMLNAGRAFTRRELLPYVVGAGVYVIDRNIDVHVRNIRKKLGRAAGHLVTVRGIGYRFDADAV